MTSVFAQGSIKGIKEITSIVPGSVNPDTIVYHRPEYGHIAAFGDKFDVAIVKCEFQAEIIGHTSKKVKPLRGQSFIVAYSADRDTLYLVTSGIVKGTTDGRKMIPPTSNSKGRLAYLDLLAQDDGTAAGFKAHLVNKVLGAHFPIIEITTDDESEGLTLADYEVSELPGFEAS